MAILNPTNLETADYGTTGWNAIYSSNFQKINTYFSRFNWSIATITYSSSITVNWNTSDVQIVTLSGNATINFSNPRSGGKYVLLIKQDATGGRTVTWGSNIVCNIQPNPTANLITAFFFVYDSTNTKYICASVTFNPPLQIAYGGTGLTYIGSANQILGVSANASGLEYKTLNGTPNQIVVSHTPNSITFATPQDIHTGASPIFAGLTLSGLTIGSIPFVGNNGIISQDNDNLFWDNTTKCFGIGTRTPVGKIHIGGDNAIPFAMQKSTVAVSAPGAGIGTLRWEPGTNPGTLKLVAYAGTSTTGTVIVDNVGGGN